MIAEARKRQNVHFNSFLCSFFRFRLSTRSRRSGEREREKRMNEIKNVVLKSVIVRLAVPCQPTFYPIVFFSSTSVWALFSVSNRRKSFQRTKYDCGMRRNRKSALRTLNFYSWMLLLAVVAAAAVLFVRLHFYKPRRNSGRTKNHHHHHFRTLSPPDD